VHDYLERWICDGTLERIHHALYGKRSVSSTL
jgi:hypothetical protein